MEGLGPVVVLILVLLAIYIGRKPLIKWTRVAEKKSTVAVEEVNFDVEKDLGILLDEINSYEGTLADEEDIEKALRAKKQSNRPSGEA